MIAGVPPSKPPPPTQAQNPESSVPTPALPPHLWGKVGGLKDFVEQGSQLNQNYWRFRKNHGFYMLYGYLHGFMWFWASCFSGFI